jgi:hypothetical protein
MDMKLHFVGEVQPTASRKVFVPLESDGTSISGNLCLSPSLGMTSPISGCLVPAWLVKPVKEEVEPTMLASTMAVKLSDVEVKIMVLKPNPKAVKPDGGQFVELTRHFFPHECKAKVDRSAPAIGTGPGGGDADAESLDQCLLKQVAKHVLR